MLNSTKTENLFSYRSNDYKIELMANVFILFKSKVYSLSLKKLKTLKKYLKKNLVKKFISSSKTFFVLSILFALKVNNQFWMYVNYRKLNVITKRNVYSILLIKKTFARVIDCKHIFKLNIIVIFNKLCINENSKNFTIFICSLKIYKYYVLLFELINDFVNW